MQHNIQGINGRQWKCNKKIMEKVKVKKAFLNFDKGAELDYLSGNDKITKVSHNGKSIWIKNKYLQL